MPRRTSRRRTSRNPQPSPRRVTVRRGSISAPGFKAKAYKGSEAAFRGRIAVERDSGMVEFPSLAQLARILREEGIPASAGEKAFGKTIKRNGERVVRQGYLSIGDTEAAEYAGPEKKLAGKIHITAPGTDVYKTAHEFSRLAEKLGIESEDVLKAFGHLIRHGRLSEETEPTKALVYGMRRTKLGHIGPRGFAAGTSRGSLVLLDTKTGTPLWGAVEEPPNTIRNAMTNRAMSLDGVFSKAKALKIPPQAVYDAFGHLMTAADRKALIASFHGRAPTKNRRRR